MKYNCITQMLSRFMIPHFIAIYVWCDNTSEVGFELWNSERQQFRQVLHTYECLSLHVDVAFCSNCSTGQQTQAGCYLSFQYVISYLSEAGRILLEYAKEWSSLVKVPSTT